MSKSFALLRRYSLALTAAFLLLGGVAYAVSNQAASTPPKTIYACVAGHYRTLNITTGTRACPDGQTKVSWNTVGPRGTRGPAGMAGRTGRRGVSGRAGATGVAGPKGTAGATGGVGPRGAPGPAGAAGSNGSVGPAGPMGPAGSVGPAGAVGAAGPQGNTGPPGPAATSAFAEFFALMPPDNPATIAPGDDVSFPQDGPTSATTITRTGASTFNLAAIGTYLVSFNVPVDEPGQLTLTLNGVDLAYTVTGRATGTSQITGESLVQTTAIDSVLTVRNPAGNSNALTISPLAGGDQPGSATLIVQQLQ
jgi:Collagen triple helix repeat (20 copies)